MITPTDIENKQFSREKRGYSPDEVDDFLDLVILDMEKLIRENKQLKAELGKAHVQVDKHMSTESTVYETLEAAKSLMNDIAASAEKRAEILLKNAEMEANLITKEAKESIASLTEEANRMKSKLDFIKGRYKSMLEAELDRLEIVGTGIFSDFENDFLPASMTDVDEKSESVNTVVLKKDDAVKAVKAEAEKAEASEASQTTEKDADVKVEKSEKVDLDKTMVNIR